jgi:type II secretory pathway component PulM
MFRRLDRRERRVVTAGAVVSAAALLFTFLVIPQARRWSDREARITLRTEQLSRLQGVLGEEAAIGEMLAELERRRVAAERRLLAGGTMAVAGSNLQRLLNRYASEAGMELERVDAVAQSAGEGTLREVPARITVRGDVRSLLDLLLRLQEGGTLLSVDELSVSASGSARGDPNQLAATIGLHGYTLDPGGRP